GGGVELDRGEVHARAHGAGVAGLDEAVGHSAQIVRTRTAGRRPAAEVPYPILYIGVDLAADPAPRRRGGGRGRLLRHVGGRDRGGRGARGRRRGGRRGRRRARCRGAAVRDEAGGDP